MIKIALKNNPEIDLEAALELSDWAIIEPMTYRGATIIDENGCEWLETESVCTMVDGERK